MENLVVEVNEGKLKGKVNKTLSGKEFYIFRGVPYAKPPVGELRFAVPVSPDPWEGVRDATKDCNICAQMDKDTKSVVGDEDCLYLNVYTPSLPSESSPQLPVMVFFHGGGFIFGHGTDDSTHGPDYLIDKGVVVVSLNYRLGILGFLSLDCKEAPGNMGLRDQVQALKWIQQNISKFGGDANNVTIFGISAGGASVEYLMMSPMAKGMFHKAIAQSGSSLLPWAQNSKVKELAAMIPVIKNKIITDEKELLKYLKSLSTTELVTMSMIVLASDKWRGGIHFGFVPTVENNGDWEPFINKSTYEMLKKGEFTKVPFMAGFCTDEGLLMVSHGASILEKVTKSKDIISHLPFKIDDTEKADIALKLKSIYLEGDSKWTEPDGFAIDFFTDVDFLGGAYVATKFISKHNSPVYFYEFAYDGSQNYLKKKYNIDRPGACHGDDGGYLVRSDILTRDLSDTDKLVRERMCLMWTNFAKYGDPTPKTDNIITTTWEPIADTGLAYLVIDDKLTMKYELLPNRMKLFEEFYEKYYNP